MDLINNKLIEGRYELYSQKFIGKGSFGEVYEGWDHVNQRNVAIKIVRTDQCDVEIRNEIFQREVPALNKLMDVMSKERIDNIIKLYGVYKDNNKIFLVMEYWQNGNLKDLQANKQQKIFSEQEAREIIIQLIDGLYLLHKTGNVHRDIKAENILKADKWKIADFGFANFGQQFNSTKGRVLYMPPQILKSCFHPFQNEKYTNKCDIYSLGVLLYKLIFNIFPFKGISEKEIYQNILKKQLSFPENIQISNELKEILKKMLAVNEEDRYSIFDLKDHSYVKQFLELQLPENINGIENKEFGELSNLSRNLRSSQKMLELGQTEFKSEASITLVPDTNNSHQKLLKYKKKEKEFQRI